MSLNIDSFRAMVGANNYGEVRLSRDGGLEKINNRFYQKSFGIGRKVVDVAENRFIRTAFLSSLSGSVDSDTFREIRAKLGIASLVSIEASTEGMDRPLTRREIKEILDIVDNGLLKKSGVSESAAANAIREGGAKFIGELLKTNNAHNPSEAVKLTETQLKVLEQRHGLELQRIAGLAEQEGQNVAETVARMVRCYLDHETLDSKATTSSTTAGTTAITRLPVNSKWVALSGLGLRLESYEKTEARGHLVLDDRDFTPVSFTTLYTNSSKNYDEILSLMAEHKDDPISSGKCNEIYRLLKGNFMETLINNMTRDPIKVTVGGTNYDGLAGVGDGEEGVRKAENGNLISTILDDIRNLKPGDMKIDQFIAAAKAMNQTIYNIPRAFGVSVAKFAETRATIESDGEDVIVTLKWSGSANPEKPVPPATLVYTVNREGMVQVQKIDVTIPERAH